MTGELETGVTSSATQTIPPTVTVNKTVQPLIGEEFDVSATIPQKKPVAEARNTVPLTLHLSRGGVEPSLGCYVYSIPTRAGDCHQTLLNNASEGIVDLAKHAGGLLAQRYSVPCYLSLSGEWEMDHLIPALREVQTIVESQWV